MEWEKTHVPPELRCSGWVDAGGLLLAFYTAPGGCLAVGSQRTPARGSWGVWTSGIPRSLSLMDARDNRFSVSGIPDTAGHLGRAENKMGALGAALSSPGLKGERAGGEDGLGGSHAGESPWSVL